MRKFIFKTFILLFPIILIIGLTEIFYLINKGDLLRLGYIVNTNNYDRNKIFKKEFERDIYFTKISEIDLSKQHKFNILIIGDSYSEQNEFGYKNYLAENSDISVLHYSRKLHYNAYPINTLTSLINGDVLDNLNVDYIILETAERIFAGSLENFDADSRILLDSLNLLFEQNKIKNYKKKPYRLFSNIYKTILTKNFNYLFDDNAYDSETYKVNTSEKLFSINKNELLFYFLGLTNTTINNNLENHIRINKELNILSKKLERNKTKLIVMFAPDKYDIYYEYITDKSKYPKPLFFDHFKKTPNKDYLYIDAKNLLNKHIPNKKDIYFYDDTHWSPKGAKIIADEIYDIISK